MSITAVLTAILGMPAYMSFCVCQSVPTICLLIACSTASLSLPIYMYRICVHHPSLYVTLFPVCQAVYPVIFVRVFLAHASLHNRCKCALVILSFLSSPRPILSTPANPPPSPIPPPLPSILLCIDWEVVPAFSFPFTIREEQSREHSLPIYVLSKPFTKITHKTKN